MTTNIVDDEWYDKARKAVEDAAQDAAANSPLFKMPGVEVQPCVDLVQWRVMRITTETEILNVLVGYDIVAGCGRASTPVQAFDAARAEATTRSGRIYRLVEAPGYNDDGEYVFQTLLGRFLTDSNHSDISPEYWDAIKANAAAVPP